MPFNTITVGGAVVPTVIHTYISHSQYLHRNSYKHQPIEHISYHEGLHLIRQFLLYASHHTVEDIQRFTSQWVPNPRWVKVDDVKIPQEKTSEAAEALQDQLGHKGIQKVGGKLWWQWRREGNHLRADWIEMRGDYDERMKNNDNGKRVMFYVHGGAYFFGSVDEHRYQMQRHARKLKARVFARHLGRFEETHRYAHCAPARYRLAPQFPFPCGLYDCLSAYLYLLTIQDPSTIILAGDSAGGGMVVSLLVILRDRGIALPAGAILISPWVDLTHSFPSVAGDSKFDYIPAHGFLQRPSASWPPPNIDDMENIVMGALEKVAGAEIPKTHHHESKEAKEIRQEAIQGFSIDAHPTHIDPQANENNPAGTKDAGERPGNTIPGSGHHLSIMIDGNLVEIKDQIQMYTTNQLISHPLVSPVLQATLGGLPPLLIQTGGGEMLRDEQIYLAHKAANPSKYQPGEAYLDEYPEARDLISRWKGTDVQLQVWDDLCHVAPTLSFTRPAKYMYRSIAQFGAWALARAQRTEIDILDDDNVSIISTDSQSGSDASDDAVKKAPISKTGPSPAGRVGRAGDPLPAFRNHMIRERVDHNGNIYHLEPPNTLPALAMPANEVGVIKPGPVRKWMAAKKKWDGKYAREKRAVQKQRAKELARGYDVFEDDEVPPPSALAGRRMKNMPREEKKGRSWGMSLWSLWGSSHDEKTIEREEKAEQEPEKTTATATDVARVRVSNSTTDRYSRSRSRRRTVTDAGQTANDDDAVDENTTTAEILRKKQEAGETDIDADRSLLSPSFTPRKRNGESNVEANATLPSPIRPHEGGMAYPFKLATPVNGGDANLSTLTLTSTVGVIAPKEPEDGKAAEKTLESSSKAVENGQVIDARRPEPVSFVTASDGLDLKG
ncbi:MAG: hypothetical protein M1827_007635 [Pycnora praestabilis]|nr:MAG: hypothetical protein M1827_007635 [Pycnora praestabilis]